MSESQQQHRELIGVPGSRERLNTPALILDRAAFRRNVERMAAIARDAGIALRPHAKTHKSADIARAQIAAGAVGQCCAKLGEAEALAAAGIDDILLTSPVVTAPAIARLIALNERMASLWVVVDHPQAVEAMAAAATAKPIEVLIDIDPGMRRTGVASAEAALALAQQIAGQPGLTYAGVQFYCGNLQHIATLADRRAAVSEQTDYLRKVIALLTDHGFAPRTITGGGTGTHRIDIELGVLNELQVGSYIFMDREYRDCELGSEFDTALMVDSRVISASHADRATIDAGLKSFATEAGAPVILSGAASESRYLFTGDEHGAIVPPAGTTPPALGERVTLGVPHCDPTVNLYDCYHVVEDDTLVAIWPVTARGRSA
jgi:3-hydroxy-D-aspartate aldolase